MSIRPHPSKAKKEPGLWWSIELGRGKGRKTIVFNGTRLAAEAYELSLKNGYADPDSDPDENEFPIPINDGEAIYFIQQGKLGAIKIGYTANSIRSRVQTIQTSNPHRIRLIGYILGGTEKKEIELHLKFREFRIHGEWFYPAPELLEYIKSMSYSERAQSIVHLFDQINELLQGVEKEKADLVVKALVERDRIGLEQALA